MQIVLLLMVTTVIVLSGANPVFASSSGCTDVAAITGCPTVNGGIKGDDAVLDGELIVGGGPGSPGTNSPGANSPGGAGSPGGGGGAGGANGAGGAGGSGGSGSSTMPPMPCEEVFAGLCYGEGPPKPVDPSPGTPTVTLNDIAVFRPHVAVQYMQPDGWMVVGLPTNFVAVIKQHVVAGTLLGSAAEVRFTPIGYRWRYGDGGAERLATTGASWQALGLREFDATATSHVYRASGTYVIELDVEYTAEYRFAGGAWTRLTGIIVLPANDLIATAGDAVTVLVDRDCRSAPAGPGC